MVYAEVNEILWDIEIQKNHAILAKRQNIININAEKRIFQKMDFAVLPDDI